MWIFFGMILVGLVIVAAIAGILSDHQEPDHDHICDDEDDHFIR